MEVQAAPLVEWLNAARRSAEGQRSYRRLVTIYFLLIRSSKLGQFYGKDALLVENNDERDECYRLIGMESFDIQESINHLLRGYRLRPQVEQPIVGGHRRVIDWEMSTKRQFTADIPTDFFTGRVDKKSEITRSFGEGSAVMRLLEISQEGCLERIKRCDQCSNWFYARFLHNRFCNLSCQQTNFRTSPEFKAKKAQKMRELRQGWKEHLKTQEMLLHTETPNCVPLPS